VAATIGKVSAVFTASTTGLVNGIAKAGSSFRALGGDSRALYSAVERLQSVSLSGVSNAGVAATAAGESFASLTSRADALHSQLGAGAITAEQFTKSMADLTREASMLSAAMDRGAQVTRLFLTAEEQHAAKLAELVALQNAGAISAETYTRAVADADAALASKTGATAALAQQMARAESITGSLMTAEEQHAARLSELVQLHSAGAISSETLSRGISLAEKALSSSSSVMTAGVATTERYMTATERFDQTMLGLQKQLIAGAISEETFSRAVQDANETLNRATGATQAVEASLLEVADQMARGAQMARALMTAEERYADEMADLNRLLGVGAITQETFNRAAAEARDKMERASQSGDGMAKSLASVDRSASGAVSRLNVLIGMQLTEWFAGAIRGATSAAASLFRMGQEQAEVIDQTSKLAARLGMTYGELAGLSLAGDLAGLSMEQIGKAATKADVALVKAQQGSALAKKAFEDLNLSVADLAGKSSADRFEAISVAIAGLPSEAERAAAATRLFGKAGAELMPLFTGGAEGIAEARREAERLGLVLTSAQGREVEKMNDSFTLVWKSIQGIIQQVEVYLAPTITLLATTFKDFVGEVGGDNIGKEIGKAIIEAAKYLATIADSVVNGFRDMYHSAADLLGVSISEEAKKLNQMQAKLSAGIAPQVAVEGTGGFVTRLDPAFAAEMDALTKAVAAQRARTTTFTDLVALGENKLNEMLAAGPEGPSKPPEVPEPPEPPPVQFEQRALKGIDSRSSEGIAEMFRLMRGESGGVQEKQLGVLEEIRDGLADAGEDEYVEVGFGF
jgi:hypothetical protein